MSEVKRYNWHHLGMLEIDKGAMVLAYDYDALRTELDRVTQQRDEAVKALEFFLELYGTSAGDSQDGWVMAFDEAEELLTRIKEQP